jgi:hypothetical protein
MKLAICQANKHVLDRFEYTNVFEVFEMDIKKDGIKKALEGIIPESF